MGDREPAVRDAGAAFRLGNEVPSEGKRLGRISGPQPRFCSGALRPEPKPRDFEGLYRAGAARGRRGRLLL